MSLPNLARTALCLGLAVLTLAGCGKPQQPAAAMNQSPPTAGPNEQPAAHQDGEAAEEHGAGQIRLSADEVRAAGIVVEALREQEVIEPVAVTATIRANQDRIAHVAPRVPGRIVKVEANLGDRVAAGQTLAVLDSLEVGEAYSAWQQARSQHDVARADFERAEKLHGDQIIAQKDHLRARAEYEKAKAALRAAQDKLRMLGVSPAPGADGKAVSTFPLATPFAGTVIEKHAILGELAQPDKHIFTVADLSTLWIEANVFEKDLAGVKRGAAATVTVAAYPGAAFPGRLTYIANVMDKESRTVQARVEVANADGRLKPEMFASAAIAGGGRSRALLLPEDAVVLLQGQATAFVEAHGGFEARPVELGDKLRGRVVVKTGLVAGERVVSAGVYTLKARLLKSQIGDAH